jgi:WD40 repeat protein
VWHRDRPGQPEELGHHDGWVRAVAVAGDGSVVTGGSDGRVRVWHRDRPGQPEELGHHAGWARAVAVAGDGSVVTGGDDGRVRVWHRDRPGHALDLPNTGEIVAIAIAPDAFIVAASGGITWWDFRPPSPGP